MSPKLHESFIKIPFYAVTVHKDNREIYHFEERITIQDTPDSNPQLSIHTKAPVTAAQPHAQILTKCLHNYLPALLLQRTA